MVIWGDFEGLTGATGGGRVVKNRGKWGDVVCLWMVPNDKLVEFHCQQKSVKKKRQYNSYGFIQKIMVWWQFAHSFLKRCHLKINWTPFFNIHAVLMHCIVEAPLLKHYYVLAYLPMSKSKQEKLKKGKKDV